VRELPAGTRRTATAASASPSAPVAVASSVRERVGESESEAFAPLLSLSLSVALSSASAVAGGRRATAMGLRRSARDRRAAVSSSMAGGLSSRAAAGTGPSALTCASASGKREVPRTRAAVAACAWPATRR